MPFALGNQFRAGGYESRAYHNNTYTYYNRDRSYPTMGYTYKGLGSGLEVRATWPESDLEMIELSTSDYVGRTPFHVYYLSVSGHMEYSFENNYMAAKNKAAVEKLPYSDSVKAYIACSIELEYALAELVSRLDTAGELENTVIALSADHYPYGLSQKAYEELAGKTLDRTFEIYENSFLLWSASMKAPIVVDKACSSLDIVPTLSNLFGLPYDSRLLFGTDILSSSYPTVLFQDRSFINGKIKFDAAHQVITMTGEEDVGEDEIRGFLKDVAERFRFSAKVIETDYYRRLFPEGE
jgi:phosphoglycerol transferase MdoB-like AlkP superfamily enzyme